MNDHTEGKSKLNIKRLTAISILVIAILALGFGYFQKNKIFQFVSSSNKAINTQVASTSTSNNINVNANQKAGDSSKIIIYNTHPWDKYNSGKTITDVSQEFSDNLNSIGVPSLFLNNTHMDTKESYKYSHDLILENVTDCSGKVLLDIMTGENTPVTKKDILVWICKGNGNYTKNKDFANSLVKEVNTLDKSIQTLVLENQWVWNQDLSDKAVTIIIGNKSTSKDKIEKDLDVLSTALKNIQY